MGNLLGPQAGEGNTALLQKYSVILALSLENSDVTSSQSASRRVASSFFRNLREEERELEREGEKERPTETWTWRGRPHKHAGARQQKRKPLPQHRRMEPHMYPLPPTHMLIESYKGGEKVESITHVGGS